MNKLILIATVALGLSNAVSAYTFTDDFNRETTLPTTDGSTIGSGWVIPAGSSQWYITGSEADRYLTVGPTVTANSIIYNTRVPIASTAAGNSPTQVSLDVRMSGAERWGGVAFNIVDPKNFYVARVRTYNTDQRPATLQVIQIVDGGILPGNDSVILTQALGNTVRSNEWYTFNIVIGVGGIIDNYALTLTETETGTLISSETFSTTAYGEYQGGYAGAYIGNAAAVFDFNNFEIVSSIPESGTISLVMGAFSLLAVAGFVRRRRRACASAQV